MVLIFQMEYVLDARWTYQRKHNDEGYSLPIQVEDYDLKRPPGLRSISSCPCRICTVAKMRGLQYNRQVKKKRCRPRTSKYFCYTLINQLFTKFAAIVLQKYIAAATTLSICKNYRRNKVYIMLRNWSKIQ